MHDAKTVVRTAIECWNAHDREGLLASYDEEATYDDVAKSQHLAGREEIVEGTFDAMNKAYPDGEIEEVLVFAEGDLVCYLGRFTGTHTGTFRAAGLEIPATGKRVDYLLAYIAEVRDGRLQSGRLFHDLLTPLEQQGLVSREQLARQLVA